MGKRVREAMTLAVRTATPSQTLAEAASLMKQEDVGALPVVDEQDGGRLVGMVTDRDIVVRAVAEGPHPNNVNDRDVASRDVVTVEADDDLDEAMTLMAKHQVRRLPVVEDGRLVGVVAQADLAGEARAKDVGETIEEISKPASSD